jgi:hypothetical protein
MILLTLICACFLPLSSIFIFTDPRRVKGDWEGSIGRVKGIEGPMMLIQSYRSRRGGSSGWDTIDSDLKPFNIRAEVEEGGGGREFKVGSDNVRDMRGKGMKGSKGTMRALKNNEIAFHRLFDSIEERLGGGGGHEVSVQDSIEHAGGFRGAHS